MQSTSQLSMWKRNKGKKAQEKETEARFGLRLWQHWRRYANTYSTSICKITIWPHIKCFSGKFWFSAFDAENILCLCVCAVALGGRRCIANSIQQFMNSLAVHEQMHNLHRSASLHQLDLFAIEWVCCVCRYSALHHSTFSPFAAKCIERIMCVPSPPKLRA